MSIQSGLLRKKKAVSPRECALLIGVPSTREAFLRKIEGLDDGSFGFKYRSSSPKLSWVAYENIASTLSRTADEAERLGVRVFRSMRLPDFDAASQYSAVTVISHWRSAQFKPSDIRDSNRICAEFQDIIGASDAPSPPTDLASLLNGLLMSKVAATQDGIGAAIRLQTAVIEARDLLVARVPNAFVGGAGVEFDDGFQPVQEIVRRIPEAFSGVFDLTVCNSLILAESLHRRCTRGLVIATSDLTFPDTRLPYYMALVRLLSRRALAYEDAFQILKEEMRKAFK